MIPSPDGGERRPTLTPQLAVRVTIVGGFALLMFGVIFFRLWFLQVLSSQAYTKQSTSNRVRYIGVPAQRGDIVDRNGTILVSSAGTYDVQISPSDLPVPAVQSNLGNPPIQDRAIYVRLARVLGISTARHRCRFLSKVVTTTGANGIVQSRDVYATPQLSSVACQMAQKVSTQPTYQNVTIERDVSKYVDYYLAERQNDFRGVEVLQVFRRTYPLRTLAAQLFGTIGPIDKNQVKLRRYHGNGYNRNSIIGQSGLEYEYDKYLRGQDGYQAVQVNALGEFEGDLRGKRPVDGNTLKLSLDRTLQQVGEASLESAIEKNYPGVGPRGGAFVAMNPQNGAIYAMGSNPSFDPTDFTTGRMTNAYYQQHYVATSSNQPLFNRAIDGPGPDGSTFKPITAIAALSSGVLSLGQTIDDPGQFCYPHTTLCLHNAGGAANGNLDLVSAIKVSDDVFFYTLGFRMNADPGTHPNGGALQHWAHLFGIGRATGVDLPNESSGALPSPYYLSKLYAQELQCENGTGLYAGKPKHPRLPDGSGGCGIANPGGWTIGDNVNTAVGQGDDQVTPLQLAVVYASLANDGTIVRPHVGLQVDSPDGAVLQSFAPAPLRHLHIDPAYLGAVQQGLREAASSPGGTSATVFGTFGQPVYGKTGTAQHNGQKDYAWYACYVPASATSKPIVVVVTVEQGGFGAVAAAPVARQILSQWFYGKPGPYMAGSSKTL